MRTRDRMTLLMLVLLCSATLSAQSTAEPKKEDLRSAKNGSALKDADADGITDVSDRSRSGLRTAEKKRDMFIDANGDGICDSREQGLGFRRGSSSTALPAGKRQQGKQK